MRKLHVIMPMAGEGSRFRQVGINTPKPLIKAKGVPFFIRSLYSIKDSFDLNDIKLTCIIQSKHNTDGELSNGIINEFPSANIVTLPKLTSGAVETCLAARPFMDEDDAILIMDCDLEWHCYNYTDSIKRLLDNNNNDSISGMLLSFKSDSPRYSYAAVTKNNIVYRTAEKDVISDNALIGAYYFNTADNFIYAADKLISECRLSDIKEYYISLLYNYLIKDNRTIILHKADYFNSFGTPEELYEYEHRLDS